MWTSEFPMAGRLPALPFALLTLVFTWVFTDPIDSFAQGEIRVDATGEVRMPADRIDFHITVTVTADHPSEAFERHKRQEEVLASAIREFGLAEELLSFQPVSLSSRQTRDRRQFVTSQPVHFRLADFSRFEELQLLLVDNEFEQFQTRFGLDDMEYAREKALEVALENGRKRAGQIAEALGKSLGEIEKVEHISHSVENQAGYRLSAMESDVSGMLDFETIIPVRSQVTMVYRIGGK